MIPDEELYDAIAVAIRKKIDSWDESYGHREYDDGRVLLTVDVEYDTITAEFTLTCTTSEREDYIYACGYADYTYEYTISSLDYIDVEWVTDEDGVEYEVDLDEIWKRL